MAQRRITAAISIGLGLAAGCATSSPHDGVPHLESTERLTFEQGTPVAYRAPTAGQISVYDENKGATVYSGPIAAGETLELDPAKQRVRVGGREAPDELRRGDVIRVTFRPVDPAGQ